MKEQKHPSYGIIQISRVSGGSQHFFGTPINQTNYFALRIYEGEKTINGSGEEVFDQSQRIPFTEIKLTAHQFSEMITTMNIGNGVPCTISNREYKKVEGCPPQESPLDAVLDNSLNGIANSKEKMDEWLDEINQIMSKSSITKKDREHIAKLTSIISGRLKSDAEFYKEMIMEVGEKVVHNAKTEIDALITSKVFQFGLDSLNSIKNKLTKKDDL